MVLFRYLATELLSVRAGDGDEEWWDRFGAHRTGTVSAIACVFHLNKSEPDVESICHEILNMYERADPGPTEVVPAASMSPKI